MTTNPNCSSLYSEDRYINLTCCRNAAFHNAPLTPTDNNNKKYKLYFVAITISVDVNKKITIRKSSFSAEEEILRHVTIG